MGGRHRPRRLGPFRHTVRFPGYPALSGLQGGKPARAHATTSPAATPNRPATEPVMFRHRAAASLATLMLLALPVTSRRLAPIRAMAAPWSTTRPTTSTTRWWYPTVQVVSIVAWFDYRPARRTSSRNGSARAVCPCGSRTASSSAMRVPRPSPHHAWWRTAPAARSSCGRSAAAPPISTRSSINARRVLCGGGKRCSRSRRHELPRPTR